MTPHRPMVLDGIPNESFWRATTQQPWSERDSHWPPTQAPPRSMATRSAQMPATPTCSATRSNRTWFARAVFGAGSTRQRRFGWPECRRVNCRHAPSTALPTDGPRTVSTRYRLSSASTSKTLCNRDTSMVSGCRPLMSMDTGVTVWRSTWPSIRGDRGRLCITGPCFRAIKTRK